MFSGIIEHQAKVTSRKWGLFRVENTFWEILMLWQSIAHDGACMTITESTDTYYEFFTMKESLSVTNFWEKNIGSFFNVERSLRLGDRIDGHFVTGHIDTVGKVILLEKRDDGSLLYWISFDLRYDTLVIEKGSITINGVSLTVVTTSEGYLTVSLIPLTQDWTNLGKSKIWESVNLEFDMMGKYVNKLKNKN